MSLFDGMSCGQIALERAGISVANYYAAEIDKHAIKVTQANYPDTIQLGDVRDVKGSDLPKIDLLIGGSPCQGFSFAGKQLNFDDPRSKLFFEYVRLLKEIKPKYFLMENVRMKKSSQDIISEHLGVEAININSNLVSAQNRNRYYWTNIPNVIQPKDRKIYWEDVKETGVNELKYYYSPKAMQWLARHSRAKNKKLRIYDGDDKMQMIEASHHKKYSAQRFFGVLDVPEDESSIAAIRGRYNEQGKTEQWIEFRHDGKSNSITTVGKDNVVVPFTLPNKVKAKDFLFRYVTPIECERLQTVPDGYTEEVSNTQRYRMLGNGWTVDVIAHIFNQLTELKVADAEKRKEKHSKQ